MSCSMPSAASMHSNVLWLVAFNTSSWGSWHLPLSLPLLPSFPKGNPSMASARALCLSSTLRSISWTEPNASRAESERVWSCSLGSPSAIWLRAPGGVKGLSLPPSWRAALPLVIWSTWMNDSMLTFSFFFVPTRLCLCAQARKRSTQICLSFVWLALSLNTFRKINNQLHSQQANKARTYLATCKINREGLAILLTRNNHSTCKLLAAPASTIPEIMTRLNLLIIICASYHSLLTFPKLTCPQGDDTQACQPRALAQTICIASPSPRWWTLTAGWNIL